MSGFEQRRDAEAGQTCQASRRTFLRGVGVTMALPWLESVPVWGAAAMAGGLPAPCPKRFAALFMGNGINPTNWWAKGAGADDGARQEPRAAGAAQAKINVISGLFNKHATGVGIHPGPDRQHPLGGRASERGRAARGASAWTRCSPGTWAKRRRSPAWSWAASSRSPATTRPTSRWPTARTSPGRDATSPVPMEVYPSLAFDSLFDNQGSRRNAEHPRPRPGAGRGPEPPGQLGPTGPSSTST